METAEKIETVQDVRKLGNILSVWAHPDDETYCAGGIVCSAVRNGQTVVGVTATRGEQGSQDPVKWPVASLGEVRTHEFERALAVLGVEEHFWLDYADGECAAVPEAEAAGRLAELITHFMPDSILTFGREGLTGHEDHRAVSRWVSRAAQVVAFRPRVYHAVVLGSIYERYLKKADEEFNIYFNIDRPPLVEVAECAVDLCLPRDVLEVKRRALAAMPSQTAAILNRMKPGGSGNGLAVECFVEA